MIIHSKPFFHDEHASIEKLEQILWPNGPVCPHCGGTEKIYRLNGSSTRAGLLKCGHCRKQFTVKVGTVFESSHVPLYKWLQAVYLMCTSKKGISANQLHRTLEVTLKTAWFMAHRIREAMKDGLIPMMGGEGKIVEVDETFIGRDYTIKPRGDKRGRGYAYKHKVLALVERGGKTINMVIDDLKAKTLLPILKEQIDQQSNITTDEASKYDALNKYFVVHDFVYHRQGEYGCGIIHQNIIEGFFSISKRGMKGVYQHCTQKHLHRYIAEFDFRYNNREISDIDNLYYIIGDISGKRLMYRDSLIAVAVGM